MTDPNLLNILTTDLYFYVEAMITLQSNQTSFTERVGSGFVHLPQVTMNDVIAAERVFGTLGHIAATETPRCRLLLLLEESR